MEFYMRAHSLKNISSYKTWELIYFSFFKKVINTIQVLFCPLEITVYNSGNTLTFFLYLLEIVMLAFDRNTSIFKFQPGLFSLYSE